MMARWLPCWALLLLAAAAAAPAAASPAAAPARPPVWLTTRGRHIIDGATGQRFKLRCASWSGGQEKWYVPGGLWAQPRGTIARQARLAGLNCIRLVWSVEAVLGPDSGRGTAVVPPQALTANPDLLGRGPLEVWDAVIQAIADEGLVVILDNHSSDAMWCCGLEDENGLWYNSRWSEQQWLQAWAIVAQRYANTSAVVGVGLRNEPRPAMLQGALKFPEWGSGGPQLDLAAAYERAAAAVLGARCTYLVFAQGLLAGQDLRGARQRPLTLRTSWPDGAVVTNQLAYEAHEYPFLWFNFDFSKFEQYAAQLDESWGYLVQGDRAPVWVGEFGVEHTAQGLNSPWFQVFSRYLRERDLDWAWWPLDGQQGPSRAQGAEETYGLLNATWNGPAYRPLLAHLRSLG